MRLTRQDYNKIKSLTILDVEDYGKKILENKNSQDALLCLGYSIYNHLKKILKRNPKFIDMLKIFKELPNKVEVKING